MSSVLPDQPKYQSSSFWTHVLWQSPRPNANGHYWRIWSHGHIEVLPVEWQPGEPDPPDSCWLTDTPENRAKARA